MNAGDRVDLDVRNRLALLSILPAKGDLLTCRIIEKLWRAAGITDQERQDYIRVEDGRFRVLDSPVKSIRIRQTARDVIMQRLQAMNTEKSLTRDHLGIWDIFMGRGSVEEEAPDDGVAPEDDEIEAPPAER